MILSRIAGAFILLMALLLLACIEKGEESLIEAFTGLIVTCGTVIVVGALILIGIVFLFGMANF